MNYPLLTTVCGLAAGMIGMERWASWRLSVARRPKAPEKAPVAIAEEQPEVEGEMAPG